VRLIMLCSGKFIHLCRHCFYVFFKDLREGSKIALLEAEDGSNKDFVCA
jgi:hypothetical protein